MPQLDKLSFATQYFWLTLFFFGLYFLTVNFFVIAVFKNLKLRNIIYKIWYFFLYKFDYSQYEDKNRKLIQANFGGIYSLLYLNILHNLLKENITNKLNGVLRRNSILNYINNFGNNNQLNFFFKSRVNSNNLLVNLNSIVIDEI